MEKSISKEEFIKKWSAHAGLPADWITPEGVIDPEYPALELVARPCNCGSHLCKGWKMINKMMEPFLI